jgi:hypothetical protein
MGGKNENIEIFSYPHPSPSISIAYEFCSMGVAQFERHSRCMKPLLETCRI